MGLSYSQSKDSNTENYKIKILNYYYICLKPHSHISPDELNTS